MTTADKPLYVYLVWEASALIGAYSSPEVAMGARDTAVRTLPGLPEHRSIGVMRFRVRTDPAEITHYSDEDYDPDTGDLVKWPEAAWWDDERQEWVPDSEAAASTGQSGS
jgi:hypothetical protein